MVVCLQRTWVSLRMPFLDIPFTKIGYLTWVGTNQNGIPVGDILGLPWILTTATQFFKNIFDLLEFFWEEHMKPVVMFSQDLGLEHHSHGSVSPGQLPGAVPLRRPSGAAAGGAGGAAAAAAGAAALRGAGALQVLPGQLGAVNHPKTGEGRFLGDNKTTAKQRPLFSASNIHAPSGFGPKRSTAKPFRDVKAWFWGPRKGIPEPLDIF